MSQPARLTLAVVLSLAAVTTTVLAVVAGPARATVDAGAASATAPSATAAAAAVATAVAASAGADGHASPLPVRATADTGPVPGAFPSTVYWTRWSTRVVYGTAAVLEGQVVVEDGAIAGAPVDLYARPAGASTWTFLATVVSSPEDGVFRFTTHKPVRTTDYRAEYDGNLVYGSSQGTKRVPVARKVTSSMASAGGGDFTFSGAVAPSYAGKAVYVQRKTSATGSWATIKTVTTGASSRWTTRVAAPRTSGTWYYRAVTPAERAFVTGYSTTWQISRR